MSRKRKPCAWPGPFLAGTVGLTRLIRSAPISPGLSGAGEGRSSFAACWSCLVRTCGGCGAHAHQGRHMIADPEVNLWSREPGRHESPRRVNALPPEAGNCQGTLPAVEEPGDRWSRRRR